MSKKFIKDPIGNRIKDQYENRTRYYLPRRTFTIIRLDGAHWHSYTKNCNKPFDLDLYFDMDSAIIELVGDIQNVKFAYTQSDEISLLLTDFENPSTSTWFDNNIQKMASVSASMLTAHFNRFRNDRGIYMLATFDSRVFTIPDRTEVMNYFIWRNQDCARNSISMVAQSKFSPKELHGKSTSVMQDMLMEKGINWAEYSPALKNGRLIVKERFTPQGSTTERTRWISTPAWKFTQDKNKLLEMIPNYI